MGNILKKLIDTNIKKISLILIVTGFILTLIFSGFGIGSSLIEVIFGYLGAALLLSGILLFVKNTLEK